MALVELDPIASDAEREPRQPDDYLPMQKVTRAIAFDEGGWDDERKEKVKELFVELAPAWHTRSGESRLAPTRDALARGGVGSGGTALEIGSGTGIHTPLLLDTFDFVVSLDIVHEMLDLSPRVDRNDLVEADAGSLPIESGAVDAIVCVNAFLFPAEYARVLAPKGRIVFVSTSGDQTPIYLPPADVVAAFERELGPVEALTSRHGWSIWTTLGRAQ